MDIDLFGDPISPPKNGRGRPEFAWTPKKSNRVLLGLVRGLTQAEIASTVDCDVKTLRKHFSRELAMKKSARLKMEMRSLELLMDQASQGSVAAIKALDARLDQLRMRDRVAKDSPRPSKAAPRLGKKEEAHQRALAQEGMFTPPPPPEAQH